MITLLTLGARRFENSENSPPGFCLGSCFGSEVCTYGAIGEQLEAMRGHKREIHVHAGHDGLQRGELSEGNTVSCARSRAPRRVR